MSYDIALDRQAFLIEYERLINSLEGRTGYVDTSESRTAQAHRAN